VAGLTDVLQEDLFSADLPASDDGLDADQATDPGAADEAAAEPEPRRRPGWLPGADVEHERHGPGWVWGAGAGRVTVRFETRASGPGPVRTFSLDDPELRLVSR
jgi:DNA polymerase-4